MMIDFICSKTIKKNYKFFISPCEDMSCYNDPVHEDLSSWSTCVRLPGKKHNSSFWGEVSFFNALIFTTAWIVYYRSGNDQYSIYYNWNVNYLVHLIVFVLEYFTNDKNMNPFIAFYFNKT